MKNSRKKGWKVDRVPIKKSFPSHAKECDIKGFKLGVTGSEWIPERMTVSIFPTAPPTTTQLYKLLKQSESETKSVAERREWIQAIKR